MRLTTVGWMLMLAAVSSGCASDDDLGIGGGSGTDENAGASGSGSNAGSANAGPGGSNTAGTSNTAGSSIGGSMSAGSGGMGGAGGASMGGAGGGGGGGLPAKCGAPVAATGATPALTAGQWTKITPPGICSGAHYGCMDIHVHPCNPYVVYVTSDMEGMWRTTDGGSTWTHIGNLADTIWCGAKQLDSPGVMEINSQNPLQMYSIGGVRGCTAGFWVSNDGGDTWSTPKGYTDQANNSVGGWTNDAYDVKADPNDFKHVLVAFHSGFEFTGDAGILESKDGGNTWIRHWPRGWGAGHSVWFLNSSTTWLVGTQGNGYWRTTDSGATFTKVADRDMQHGGTEAFYSKTGVLYVGALSNILRSTDNGATFTLVGPDTGNGYYHVIGDGNLLYTQLANTGGHPGANAPYVVSSETDGITWKDYSTQTFTDGPYRMDFDAHNRIIYSANWNAGVWALKVMDP